MNVRGSFLAKFFGVFAGALLLLFGLRAVFHHQDRCASPCADAGPSCAPLKINLEFVRAERRKGLRDTWWYRVELRNNSCEALRVDSRQLLTGLPFSVERHYEDLFLRVLGPDGREISTGNESALANQFAPLLPYETDPRANLDILRKIADRRKAELADGSPFARINQEDNHLMLRPGESVATTPSALEPHFPDRLPGWDHPEDESTPEGRALSAKLKRDATRFYAGILDKKRLPPPPPAVSGFTSFAEGASLFRPGKYKIRAVFNGQIEAVSIYPYADRLPAIVRKYLRFFGSSIGVDLVPDVKAHSIRVAAESREVVLEIGR